MKENENKGARSCEGSEQICKKIFFTDLDGTLLNDQKEITPGNQAAIDQALQAGHIVVITTGRPLASALIQAERLGLLREGCYVIAFNGGEIYDTSLHRSIYRRTVPKDLIVPIFEEAHRRGIYIQTFSGEEVLSEEDRPELYDYVKRTLQTCRVVPSIAEELAEEPCKLLAIEETDRSLIEDFRRYLTGRYAGTLNAYFSNNSYLEIVPDKVTKGQALLWLCGFLQVPVENSVSAGDAPNDVEMIEAAGIGVAMANSFPGVKEYADYVTDADNNHDGAAEIIHRFILKNE
ncbi:MAG: Cof-type HAD-IIB family hydrolase [Lachnospiraceae bacterium]|nr:Cof-type HAD-IIB family hydrolase [Lachnospiraceae bacterium]